MNDLTINLNGLASHLVHNGLLQPNIAIDLVEKANRQKQPFITYLIKNNILSSKQILSSCSKSFGLPIFDLTGHMFEATNELNFNSDLIRRYRIIPIKKQNNILDIGLSDPTDKQAIDIIKFYTGLQISIFLIAEDQLDTFINKNFNESLNHAKLELSMINDLTNDETQIIIQENSINYDEPVIRFVDHIIQHALHQSASDIHIEPYEKQCRIRYRQDGILYEMAEIPVNLATRLTTRLKVMAKLDITERRLPQDGRFQVNNIDIRINTCPMIFGEKIVLRLLDANRITLDINELGFSENQKSCFLTKISQHQGLVLVTGPTGSGKTVTLYSALHHLNTSHKNISSVEDPVEIQLKGINQVNVNYKINLHFATILRTFLRQDPDILMVGEIRDTETADIAIQAAQTGHLVFSTLHTNGAIETIARLQSMGIASYNIASSISLIIAQRLIRKLCPHCKLAEILPKQSIPEYLMEENEITVYRAMGCQQCHQGYRGRIGLYEFLPMTECIRELIMANSSTSIIMGHAKQEGFLTLREAGLKKVLQGITSLSEINRVTQ